MSNDHFHTEDLDSFSAVLALMEQETTLWEHGDTVSIQHGQLGNPHTMEVFSFVTFEYWRIPEDTHVGHL